MPFLREHQNEKFHFVEWFAPAKVNIYLRILGKRADGYHNLDSLMVPLSFGDLVRVGLAKDNPSKEPPIVCEVQGAQLPLNGNNLAFQAGEIFRKSFKGELPALQILLKKKIPLGAGLGGGSSDAAAVLLAINHLLNKPCSPTELHDMAKTLGADVAFFLETGAFWAKGIGDQLERLPNPEKYWFVLVNPNFSVSTAWVYQNFDLALTSRSRNENIAPFDHPENLPWHKILANDLEEVTLKAYPKLREIKEHLILRGAHGALMSGSGPTLFGLFSGKEGQEKAQRVHQELLDNQKDWNVFLAHNLI